MYLPSWISSLMMETTLLTFKSLFVIANYRKFVLQCFLKEERELKTLPAIVT